MPAAGRRGDPMPGCVPTPRVLTIAWLDPLMAGGNWGCPSSWRWPEDRTSLDRRAPTPLPYPGSAFWGAARGGRPSGPSRRDGWRWWMGTTTSTGRGPGLRIRSRSCSRSSIPRQGLRGTRGRGGSGGGRDEGFKGGPWPSRGCAAWTVGMISFWPFHAKDGDLSLVQCPAQGGGGRTSDRRGVPAPSRPPVGARRAQAASAVPASDTRGGKWGARSHFVPAALREFAQAA